MLQEIPYQKIRIECYEEAADIIRKYGILPLASLIPGHPSLESLTPQEHWHTGSVQDPWLWRTRFPAEGIAAYGKFMKKKAVLISREWFPLVLKILGTEEDPKSRYEDGFVSKSAVQLFELIQEDEGIETRTLRQRADMKPPELKKTFDQAVLELQSSLSIVISGIREQFNELGEKKGWNSTSYETVDYWLKQQGLNRLAGSRQEAQDELKQKLEQVCTPEAQKFLHKIFQIQ